MKGYMIAITTIMFGLAGCRDSAGPSLPADTGVYVPDAIAVAPSAPQYPRFSSVGVLAVGDTMRSTAVGYRLVLVPAGNHPFVAYRSDSVKSGAAWQSRSPSIASVDNYGKVTAHSPGTATLVATSTAKPSLVDSAAVVVLDRPIAFAQVFTSSQMSCALTSAGAAWCWGDVGNRGDGATDLRVGPFPVAGGQSFTTLSVGENELSAGAHACGLTSDGTAYC
jgi:hypothetical protein